MYDKESDEKFDIESIHLNGGQRGRYTGREIDTKSQRDHTF